MQLSGLSFLYIFLPVVLAIYYFPPVYKRNMLRNTWLFFVSMGFYLWTSFGSMLFLLLFIVANYCFGLWVGNHAKEAKGKRIVLLACIFDVAILAFFKVSIGLTGGISTFLGLRMSAFFENIILPLGISFYTFRALSYIIDVYRKKTAPQRNFITLGLFLSFFPCAISGPIFKYNQMIGQIENRKSTMEMFGEGVKTFIIGMGKSVILGAQLLTVSNFAFSASSSALSVFYAWLGALAYTLYIYYDFSGYSQMAIGIGKMFGFEIPRNFHYPYISRSVSEYWRRWHITLGEWFQEYLYYPVSLGPALKIRKLAGKKLNRKHAGMVSIGFTLLIVWICTGAWHGLSMPFILWGLLNFVFVFIDTYYKPSKYSKITSFVGFVGTSFITLFTKVIFNSKSLSAAFSYIGAMLHLNGNRFIDVKSMLLFKNYFFYIFVGLLCIFPVAEWLNQKISTRYPKGKGIWELIQFVLLAGLFVITLSYVNSGGHNPPMYANF